MSRGSDRWRHQAWGRPCRVDLVPVSVGDETIKVEKRARQAFWALDFIIDRHDYDVHPAYPDGDTGAYNCRHIGSDPNRPWSAHAWGIAIDINWKSNPDGSRLEHDYPPGMVEDIQRITTIDGIPVWRWGGDWDRDPRTGHTYYDAMHWEIIATPAELQRGIRFKEIDMLRQGDTGRAVFELQRQVNRVLHESGRHDNGPLTPDGVFGPATEKAVESAQQKLHWEVTGVVDAFFSDRLLHVVLYQDAERRHAQ